MNVPPKPSYSPMKWPKQKHWKMCFFSHFQKNTQNTFNFFYRWWPGHPSNTPHSPMKSIKTENTQKTQKPRRKSEKPPDSCVLWFFRVLLLVLCLFRCKALYFDDFSNSYANPQKPRNKSEIPSDSFCCLCLLFFFWFCVFNFHCKPLHFDHFSKFLCEPTKKNTQNIRKTTSDSFFIFYLFLFVCFV